MSSNKQIENKPEIARAGRVCCQECIHIFSQSIENCSWFSREKKNAARAGRQLRGMCNIEAPETRCHMVFHEMDFWWERIKVSGGRSAAWILSIVAGFRPFSSRLYPAENPLKQSTREKSAGTFPNGSWKRSDRVVGRSNGSKIKSIGKRIGNIPHNKKSFSESRTEAI